MGVLGSRHRSPERHPVLGVKLVAAAVLLASVGGMAQAAPYAYTTPGELGPNDLRISYMGPDGDIDYRTGKPAVAYSVQADEFLVVWHGLDNTGLLADKEYEVWGRRVDGTAGTAVGDQFRISTMGPDGNPDLRGVFPDVAYNSVRNEFLVVWEGNVDCDASGRGEDEVWVQRLRYVDGELVLEGNRLRVSEMGPEGDGTFIAKNPVVTYNPDDDEYLVVWPGEDDVPPSGSEEYAIYGQRLGYNQVGGLQEVGSNDFHASYVIAGDDTANVGDADVGYNASENEYFVVWSGNDGASPLVEIEEEIWGQRISADGSPVAGGLLRLSDMCGLGSTACRTGDPLLTCSVTRNRWLVVWQGTDNVNGLVEDENEVFGQFLEYSEGSLIETGPNDFRISHAGPDGDPGYQGALPDITHGSAGDTFLVVWQADDDSEGLVRQEYEVWGQFIDGGAEVGAPLVPNAVRLSDMGPDGDRFYVGAAVAVAAAGTSARFLVVWVGDDNIGPLVNDEFEVFGQLYTTNPPVYLPAVVRSS